MTTEGPDRSALRKLQADLRVGLRAVAAAPERKLEKEIDDLEAILEEYNSLLEGDPDPGSDLRDLDRRLAASRLELEKLRAGDVSRRDAVGRIRLMLLPQSRDSGDS